MDDRDEDGPRDNEWIDDIIARALEDSISNSPEFNPTEVSTSDSDTDERDFPLRPLSSMTEPTRVNDSDTSLTDSPTRSAEVEYSPYPDNDFEDASHTGEKKVQPKKAMKGFLEWGLVILGALLVAFLIKTFLMQAYYIPSSSMTPTLQIGDRVLVNKLSYEMGDISRGDLIVFHRPPMHQIGESDLIKRVIGLEGETIEIIDGLIYITEVGTNGRKVLIEPYLSSSISTAGFMDTSLCEIATTTSCLIPEKHIFVLGDNRSGSRDSRYFGPIPENLVVGRAFIRLWPLSSLKFL
jgi:signal peptidase I